MSREDSQSRQLRRSVSEGNAVSLMQGFGVEFVSAFALKLGASVSQIGLLAALPQLVHALAQFLALHLSSRNLPRLKLITAVVFVQALLWLPVATLAIFHVPEAFWFLLALNVLITAASALVNPFWTSWLSDWVPAEHRGAYFSFRNKVNGFTLVAAMFTAGLVLGVSDGVGFGFVGFAVIFCAAAFGRLVSFVFFKRASERNLPICRDAHAWSLQDAKSFPGFSVLVKYSAALTFAVSLASPFFIVYLLQDRGFSYATYAMIVAGTALASFISQPYWGRLADQYGNKLVLKYTALLIPVIPALYLLPVREAAFFFLLEAFSSIIWSGQKLSAFNLLIENTPVTRRPQFVSYYNIATGFATFAGALVGGFIAAGLLGSDLLFFGASGILWLFLLSCVGRALAALLFVPVIRGSGKGSSAQKHFFFKAVTILPLRSMSFVVQHDTCTTVEMIGRGVQKLGKKEDRFMHRVEGKEEKEVRHVVHAVRFFRRIFHRLLKHGKSWLSKPFRLLGLREEY